MVTLIIIEQLSQPKHCNIIWNLREKKSGFAASALRVALFLVTKRTPLHVQLPIIAVAAFK